MLQPEESSNVRWTRRDISENNFDLELGSACHRIRRDTIISFINSDPNSDGNEYLAHEKDDVTDARAKEVLLTPYTSRSAKASLVNGHAGGRDTVTQAAVTDYFAYKQRMGATQEELEDAVVDEMFTEKDYNVKVNGRHGKRLSFFSDGEASHF